MPSIKFRDGWSGPGSQTANWMARDDQREYAQRLRDGVLTERVGDFVNVYQDNPAPPATSDGFYSLGDMVTTGARIVGAADGRNFADRGPAPEQGGFVFAELGYFGKGFGEVLSTTTLSTLADFDGASCTMFQGDISHTRDGRTLKPYFSVLAFIPYGQTFTQVESLPGGYWFDGTSHKFACTRTTPLFTFDTHQHVQAVIVDDGSGTPIYVTPPFLTNQLGWYADLAALAPGVVLKMDRYLRPTYAGSTVDVSACPGLVFLYTEDAGYTWTTLATPAMWSTELGTLRGMTVDHGALALQFNNAIAFANVKTAPLSRTKSVVQALVPYWDGTEVKARIKLGILDRSSGYSITETATLFDGSLDDAEIYGGRPPLAVPGGVLIFSRDMSSGANNSWALPAMVRFTSDGSSLIDRGVLPAKENYMGLVTGYDPKTLVVPMWDGRHSVYASKDYGVTWRRVGTITNRGVPPNDAPTSGEEQFHLQDFPVITFLRKDDLPAFAAPLTPWLYDSRQPDPPAI